MEGEGDVLVEDVAVVFGERKREGSEKNVEIFNVHVHGHFRLGVVGNGNDVVDEVRLVMVDNLV